MPHTLGIDVGTSGVRAVLLDDAGSVVAEASQSLRQQSPAAWWSACERVLTELATDPGLGRVSVVALDATSSTVLACDADGNPTGPVLMYSDQRAEVEARRIAALAPADSGAQGASSSLAKLLWLRTHQPDQTPRILHQADWLAGRLLGKYAHSDANNALKLGYDPVRQCWPDWLTALDIDSRLLPRVEVPGTCLGPVDPALGTRFGLPEECRVAAGTTDSTAACLATGASAPGDAVSVLGSTLVLKILAERPVFAPEFGVYSHRVGDYWLVGGASNTGGAILRHYFDESALERLSLAIDPEQDSGLDYYPLLGKGERFPDNNPDLAPRLSPRPADDARFLHGLLEGIARIEHAGYARLAALGAPAVTRIYSIGGGAANPTWQRIRQRLLGVPMHNARYAQAAAGAALLARRCLQSLAK